MARTDFDFKDWYDFRGKPVTTLNLDSKGKAHPYDTVGTWQFEAYRVSESYRDELWANPWGKVAEVNRADMPYRFDVSYITSESTCEGIMDGHATSIEECKDMFMRMWGRIKRHKYCNDTLPYEWHHYCEHPFVEVREKEWKVA
jgi:hypothetical protein